MEEIVHCGSWTAAMAPGWRKPMNPQFHLSVSESLEKEPMTITLQRTTKIAEGLIFFVLKAHPTFPNSPIHTVRNEDIVHQSRYLVSEVVSSEVSLAKGHYVILVCRGRADTPSLPGDFKLTISYKKVLGSSSGCEDCGLNMEAIPEDTAINARGSWELPFSSGGYKSPMNPQFVLDCHDMKEDMQRALLRLTRKSGEPDGIIFFLFQANEKKFLEEIAGLNLVMESAYLSSNSVTVEMTLRRGQMFHILCCHSHEEEPEFLGDIEFTVLLRDRKGVSLDRVRGRSFERAGSFEMEWKHPDMSGGYKSPANPQVFIKLSAKTSLRLKMSRECTTTLDGICMFLYAGTEHSVARKNTSDQDLIAQSSYVQSTEVELNVDDLPGEMGYTMLCTRGTSGKEGESPLRVEVFAERKSHVEYIDIAAPFVSVEEGKTKIDGQDLIQGRLLIPVEEANLIVDEIIRRCKECNGIFVDIDFPANETSILSREFRDKSPLQNYGWKRLHDLADDPQMFLNGIDVDDLVQGYVGDCWLMNAISAVASSSSSIERLFYPKLYADTGVFAIQCFVEGEWKAIIVDDNVPISNKMDCPQFAHARNPNECWVSLLEKSIAKYCGSYTHLVGSLFGRKGNLGMESVLSYLTGGTTLGLKTADVSLEELWRSLVEYHKKGFVTCSTVPYADVASSIGLVEGHGYALLGVYDLSNGDRVIKLRNTWGKGGESTAKYSDDDVIWTEKLRREVGGHRSMDDGCFFMEVSDFCKMFQRVCMCSIESTLFPLQRVIHGTWDGKKGTSGGYQCVRNPMYAMDPWHEEGECIIELFVLPTPSVSEAGKYGIQVVVCREDDMKAKGVRESVVAQSKYLLSSRVKLNVMLPPLGGVRYVIIPTIGPASDGHGVTSKFKLIIRAGISDVDVAPFTLSEQ